MVKFQLVISVSLFLLFVGCVSSSDTHEKEVSLVVVDLDQPMMTPEEMAQHFTNVRMVILRGVMLTDIDRLIDWGDRFLVLDRRGQQAVIFDSTGNCIRQIKRLGKGPGEYIQLRDCTIDNTNNELILYADRPGKLIWFDQEGNYLRGEQWTEGYFDEMINAGDDLFAINGGKGRAMADQTIAQLSVKDKIAIEEFQLPHKDNLPNMSSGTRLTSNGKDVWLSRPFDYTLYKLDSKTKRFVPRYKLDLGKAALPDGYVTLKTEGSQMRKDGFVFQMTRVSTVANYLFFRTTSQDFYMMDTVSKALMRLGATPVAGMAIGGYGLLENQNRRIVHTVPVSALLMWSEEMKNKGQKNAELEKVMAANEEFMNPVLLFQDVR